MKILLVSAANNIHTIRWANALCSRGHQVSVAACKNHIGRFDSQYDKRVKIIALRFSAPLGYYLNAKQLYNIVHKGNFEIVNIHYASGYGTLGRLAKLKNALLNIWGSDVYLFPYQNKLNQRILKKNLSYYQCVASTSECMAKQASLFVERNYLITPFGVDINKFFPNKIQLDNDKVIVGTVKALQPIYGIEDSINAFIVVYNRLKKEGRYELAEKLQYEIYGKGEQKEYLQDLIDKNHMSDRIKLCGYIDNENLPKIINRFSIFCCCSHSESFGVAVLEAMACGVPVVTSNADGFLEIVKVPDTGFVAQIGDVERIAEHLYTLILNSELCTQMGSSAVQHVQTHYSWESSVNRIENIYRTMSFNVEKT